MTRFCKVSNWDCEDWDCEDCELDEEGSRLVKYRCISEKLDQDRQKETQVLYYQMYYFVGY